MQSMSQISRRLALPIALTVLLWRALDCPSALAEERQDHYFPNVTLTTEKGQKVRFYDDLVRNKIVLIHFMYTECERICEPGTQNLVQVQKALGDRLGREVFIYSISLDPEHDTPDVLEAYATTHHANWTFLTGREEDIAALRAKLGLASPTPELRAKLKLAEPNAAEYPRGEQHSGMIVIGYEAFNKWSKASVLSTPDQILQIIERMKPPSGPKR